MGSLFTSRALWERGPYCKVACGVDWNAPFALMQEPSFSVTALCPVPAPCRAQRSCCLMEWLQKPVGTEDISGAVDFFMVVLLLLAHLHGSPLAAIQLHLLIHSCSFLKTWVDKWPLWTSCAMCTSVTSLLHTSWLLMAALTAAASAFLLSQFHPRDHNGPARPCAPGHGARH